MSEVAAVNRLDRPVDDRHDHVLGPDNAHVSMQAACTPRWPAYCLRCSFRRAHPPTCTR